MSIIRKYRNNKIFALESERYAKEVANPVFRIDSTKSFEQYGESEISSARRSITNLNFC